MYYPIAASHQCIKVEVNRCLFPLHLGAKPYKSKKNAGSCRTSDI